VDAAAVAGAARLVLAGVLVFAAIAKLRAPDATRRHTVALIGERYGAGVARALPGAELVVALLLCLWWSWVPGVLALVLLLVFSLVLVRALTRRLPCACFGGSTRGEAGSSSVVRNGLLLAYAVLALGSPSGAPAVAFVVTTTVLATGAAVAVYVAR
jgi:hypothetical protein